MSEFGSLQADPETSLSEHIVIWEVMSGGTVGVRGKGRRGGKWHVIDVGETLGRCE